MALIETETKGWMGPNDQIMELKTTYSVVPLFSNPRIGVIFSNPLDQEAQTPALKKWEELGVVNAIDQAFDHAKSVRLVVEPKNPSSPQTEGEVFAGIVLDGKPSKFTLRQSSELNHVKEPGFIVLKEGVVFARPLKDVLAHHQDLLDRLRLAQIPLQARAPKSTTVTLDPNFSRVRTVEQFYYPEKGKQFYLLKDDELA